MLRPVAFLPGLRPTRGEPSGQLGNQLEIFGLAPGSGGARPHVAPRAEGEHEFSDVVPVRGIHDDDKIALAGGQINLLDLDPQFLREIARGL